MHPNYLILTPDGVGSTYLQRALTVYLNSAGFDYYNTHEILNGLVLKQGHIYKDFSLGYSQTIPEICRLLQSTKNSIVSRIAQYHISNRLQDRNESYKQLYDVCNNKFDKIFYCIRNPFEYALSWSIRNNTDTLNVYSVKERIKIHGENTKQTIDLKFFNSKLKQYSAYEYWVQDNFHITKSINYDDSHSNIDKIVKEMTGLNHNIKDRFGISLQDYSTIRYRTSMYNQTKDKKWIPDKEKSIFALQLHMFIRLMVYNTIKMPTFVPVKMNTMQDKQSRIINFQNAVEVYNKWVKGSNTFKPIVQSDITEYIIKENKIYNNNV